MGGFELLTRGFKLITHGFELVTRGVELATRGSELALLNLTHNSWFYEFKSKSSTYKNIYGNSA